MAKKPKKLKRSEKEKSFGMPFDGMTQSFPQSRADINRKSGEQSVTVDLLRDIREGAMTVPVGDAVYAISGDAMTVITPPLNGSGDPMTVHLRIELDTFWVRAGDQIQRTASAVNPSANTLTISGHGYLSGNPSRVQSSGNMPAGLTTSGIYFVGVVDANTISLHNSRADAEALAGAVPIDDAGTGTITLGASSMPAITATDQAIGDNAFKIERALAEGKETFSIRGPITVRGDNAASVLAYWFYG